MGGGDLAEEVTLEGNLNEVKKGDGRLNSSHVIQKPLFLFISFLVYIDIIYGNK